MSKDYKPSQQKKSKNSGSPFLSGMLVGIILGVGASVALTVYLKGENSPFYNPKTQNNNAAEQELTLKKTEETIDANKNSAMEDPNKFDFYTILPETESKVTEQEVKSNTTIKKDTYFLQVGAFENVDDADNMKAKLALQGFEALVQTANIPEKGTWHRVRVGPLTNVAQINKIRGDLKVHGFNADLIKVHTEGKTN